MSTEEQDLLYCERKRKLAELRRLVFALKTKIVDAGRTLQTAGEKTCALGRNESAEPLASAQAMAALNDAVSPQLLLDLVREYREKRVDLADLEQQVSSLEP